MRYTQGNGVGQGFDGQDSSSTQVLGDQPAEKDEDPLAHSGLISYEVE
jgi:hypothetical protein